MHKGVILLVKAEDRDDALDKVNDFMEPYGEGDVWDWFSIGNRWHNTLAPKDKVETFTKKVNELYPQTKGSYATNDIENETVRPIIQAEWEKLGLRGKNPFWSSYGFDVKDSEEDYNVVPLSDCIDTVKDWVRDVEKVAEEEFAELVKAREETKEKKAKGEKVWDMSAYHASRYKDAIYNNFCFDSNVFDVTEEAGEKLPEDIKGYWAIMIDMHN